jgi:hypothetical protein
MKTIFGRNENRREKNNINPEIEEQNLSKKSQASDLKALVFKYEKNFTRR